MWPTHGAGSFCSAPLGAERTSTIGREIATNPLLNMADEDAFVTTLLGSLGSFPPYFLRLAEANRRGPAILDPASTGRLASLPASAVRRLRADGTIVLDVRPVTDYAAAHLPGALSIPLRAQFATWLGWLAPPDTPLVVIRNDDQDPAEIVGRALNVGYDRLVGELDGGIDAWTAAGQPTARTELSSLRVAADGTMTGYSRDLFPHWHTVSGACDTRASAASVIVNSSNSRTSSSCG